MPVLVCVEKNNSVNKGLGSEPEIFSFLLIFSSYNHSAPPPQKTKMVHSLLPFRSGRAGSARQQPDVGLGQREALENPLAVQAQRQRPETPHAVAVGRPKVTAAALAEPVAKAVEVPQKTTIQIKVSRAGLPDGIFSNHKSQFE
jgi:hypothetical protein